MDVLGKGFYLKNNKTFCLAEKSNSGMPDRKTCYWQLKNQKSGNWTVKVISHHGIFVTHGENKITRHMRYILRSTGYLN